MLKRTLILLIMTFSLMAVPVLAQPANTYTLRPEDGMQVYTGMLNAGERVFVTVEGGGRGMRLYVYAGGDIGSDPQLFIVDDSGSILRNDDDSGGNLNAMTYYTLEYEGTFYVQVYIQNAPANYRVAVGLDTPEVLDEGTFITTTGKTGETLSCEEIGDPGRRFYVSDNMERAESTNFVIHFTTQGSHAATRDYVNGMRDALEASLAFQLNAGWDMPPADCDLGGDSRIDVYIVDFFSLMQEIAVAEGGSASSVTEPGLYGLAVGEAYVGDNPNSTIIEANAAFGYMMLDNDMSFADIDPFVAMQATAVHELHHLLQFGYEWGEFYAGLYEAGAMWVEVNVLPESKDAVTIFLRDMLANPDQCIGASQRSTQSSRQYGEWVMIESMARDLGANAYNLVWQELVTDTGLAGFYKALSRMGTTPHDVIARMNARLILGDFPLSEHALREVYVEASASGSGDVTPQRNGIQSLGADIVRLDTQGIYQFDTNRSVIDVYVLAIDRNANIAHLYHPGRQGVVDVEGYTDSYVILVNTEQHQHGDNCEYLSWRLSINEVGGAIASVAPETIVLDASRFTPLEPGR